MPHPNSFHFNFLKCTFKGDLQQQAAKVFMFFLIRFLPGECGGLAGVPLLRLWPRMVFLLPRPDHPASGATLYQAFCGRCLYFTYTEEPEEWISEEDSTSGANRPNVCPLLKPLAPESPQICLGRPPELQWRKLQAQGAGEWDQPAGER